LRISRRGGGGADACSGNTSAIVGTHLPNRPPGARCDGSASTSDAACSPGGIWSADDGDGGGDAVGSTQYVTPRSASPELNTRTATSLSPPCDVDPPVVETISPALGDKAIVMKRWEEIEIEGLVLVVTRYLLPD
jgi:hypothetical protein